MLKLTFRKPRVLIGQRDLLARGMTYSQSPQVISLGDRNRVFFTSRKKSDHGWISSPYFVDFDTEFENRLSEIEKVLIEEPDLGAFDSGGIFPFSPFFWGDHLYALTTGWNPMTSVAVETAVGLCASSDDGRSFQRCFPGPVITSGPNEPFLVCDGMVTSQNELDLYYLFGTEWVEDQESGQFERIYRIGHRSSSDPENWPNGSGNEIVPVKSRFEAQALPYVVHGDEHSLMVFSYRNAFNFRGGGVNAYDLDFAVARRTELDVWNRDEVFFTLDRSEWDDQMRCYPSLLRLEQQLHLLYNGNYFGRDGILISSCEADQWT